MPDTDLKRRQEAGARFEQKMLDFLLQYNPTHDLKVIDVIAIASAARLLAFEEFSEGR